MEAADLCVPIYLNQQVVFDMLAVLEGGFAELTELTTSASDSEGARSSVGGSIGVANVFGLLRAGLGAGRESKTESGRQTEAYEQRVHTPTSLFARLRKALVDEELLKALSSHQEIADASSGDFVEFKAVLRKNPIVHYLEVMLSLLEMAALFPNGQSGGQASQGKRTGKKGGQRPKAGSETEQMMRQFRGLLDGLQSGGSLELIAELLDVPEARAVLSTKIDYFSDRSASEIVDGEFRVLGKIVRMVPEDGPPINLLRKTALGALGREILDQLREAFSELPATQIELPQFEDEVGAPACQVVPIAIFV